MKNVQIISKIGSFFRITDKDDSYRPFIEPNYRLFVIITELNFKHG